MTHDEQKPVREAYEANMREHYTLEQLKERNDRNDPNRCHLVMPSEYLIEAAINATNYKYFGDYEMSAEQREAVEILIDAAEAGQAATTRESELLAVIRTMDAKLADAIDLIEREVSSSASQITLPSKDWVGLDGKLVKQYPYQTYDIEAMREARRLAEQVV